MIMKDNIYKIFDSLPNDALLSIKDVCKLFSCSPPTIYRGVKNGTFPKPIRPTVRTSRWRVGDLRKALKGNQNYKKGENK